MELLKISFFSF